MIHSVLVVILITWKSLVLRRCLAVGAVLDVLTIYGHKESACYEIRYVGKVEAGIVVLENTVQ